MLLPLLVGSVLLMHGLYVTAAADPVHRHDGASATTLHGPAQESTPAPAHHDRHPATPSHAPAGGHLGVICLAVLTGVVATFAARSSLARLLGATRRLLLDGARGDPPASTVPRWPGLPVLSLSCVVRC